MIARPDLHWAGYSTMQVIAQLYELPGGREVGHGSYMMRIDDKSEIVRVDLQHVTKELAEKTKMLK